MTIRTGAGEETVPKVNNLPDWTDKNWQEA
jgi:hypothetical protein